MIFKMAYFTFEVIYFLGFWDIQSSYTSLANFLYSSRQQTDKWTFSNEGTFVKCGIKTGLIVEY